MSFRSKVVLQFQTITAIIDVDNAVASQSGLKNVCLGATGTEHVPTALKQQALKCPECGNDDATTMKKARVDGPLFTVVEKDEVEGAKGSAIGASKSVISLLAHPADEVHMQSIQGGSAYQLKPSGPHMVPFVSLLVDTMKRHPEVAFTGLWTPSSRQNFYEVRPYGDVLVMEERCRTEDLKIIQTPIEPVAEAYQKMIDQILAVSVVSYDPANYQDAYLAKLTEVLASKVAQDGILAAKSKSTPAAVVGAVDLSTMLLNSLKAANASAPAVKAPAKKKAARQKPQVA